MASVEVLKVTQQRPLDDRLRGCNLDEPKADHRALGPTVTIAGWALTSGGPALAIEVACDGFTIRRLPTGQRRPDLAAAFPDVPKAEVGGFRADWAPGLGEHDYDVRAVLPGQARAPLGSVRLRRAAVADGPLVSVVIPCYRQGRFLGQAIESALGQSYPHLEVVVVDDGSPDNTAAVASRYPGVAYLRQPNGGLSAARNAGLRRSRGAFLVFLDSDDRLLAGAVAAGLACFHKHPECAFVHGRFQTIGPDGALLSAPRGVDPGKDHYLELLRRNYIEMHATVMYRRAIFETVGEFDESMRSCEDYDLYLRIARKHPICCHDMVIAQYRRHGMNMTNNVGKILQYALTALRSQGEAIRGNRRRREAFRDGLKFFREVYGEQLVAEMGAAVEEGDWRVAGKAMLALVRYHPRGMTKAIDGFLLNS